MILAGSARGVIADSVAAFLIFIRTRYSMFEARQWGDDEIRVAPVFRDLHFTNIHRFFSVFARSVMYISILQRS